MADETQHSAAFRIAAVGVKAISINEGTKSTAIDVFYALRPQALLCETIQVGLPATPFIGDETVFCGGVYSSEPVADLSADLERRLRNRWAEPNQQFAGIYSQFRYRIFDYAGSKAAPAGMGGTIRCPVS